MPWKETVKELLLRMAMGSEELVRGTLAYSPEDLSHFRNFLFLQYRMQLCYCVHDTPIYEALRTCMPEAKITVATRGAGYETLRHNPYIDNLISTVDPLEDTFGAAKQLKAELRRLGLAPQVAITNASNWHSRLSLLNLLAGKHVRLGYSLIPQLYHLPQKYDANESLIDNNLCLVTIFGCPVEHVEPRVFFHEQDVERVRGLLQSTGLKLDRPIAVLATQDSSGQPTGWHADRFTQVIRHVGQRCQIVFAGTRADDEAIKALRIQTGPLGALASTSFAGLTTVPELSALLCLSDYVVSLAQGTMHVGRAAGVPMVVLGPSWQKPQEWLPLGRERVRILRGDDIENAPENYQLDEIQPGAVIAAFDELMTLYPPSDLERSARVRKSLSAVDHASRA